MGGQNFNFGNPLKQFHAKLKGRLAFVVYWKTSSTDVISCELSSTPLEKIG